MDIKAYDRYIERFNNAERGAFVENLAHDVVMQNGGMFLCGIAAVLEHYEQRIWPWFRETVHIDRVIGDASTLAVLMWTHFEALKEAQTVFGPVQPGDMFDYRGVVMYDIRADGKFGRIFVSYLTFSSTPAGGLERPQPIPH